MDVRPAASSTETTRPSASSTAVVWPSQASGVKPVAKASGYTVKQAGSMGGPYTTVATSITATKYPVTGLTRDKRYYFVVSATVNGKESVNSDEAQVLHNNGAVGLIAFPSDHIQPSSSSLTGDNLSDGNTNSMWMTHEGYNWQNADVTFDLGKQYTVSRLNIYNHWSGRALDNNRCWKTYEIYVYDDPDNKGSALATDKPTLSQSLTGPALSTVNITTPKKGRLVHLKMRTLYSSPNPPWDRVSGLNEVEIYGAP